MSARSACLDACAFIPATEDIRISGFCCTDLSRMNKNHAENRSIIKTGGKRTGSTFFGTLRHAAIYRPRIILLEKRHDFS